MQADEVAEQTEAAIAAAKEARDRFLGLEPEASFLEVIEAFDRIGRPLDAVHGPVSLGSQTHPVEALREACQQAVRDLAAFSSFFRSAEKCSSGPQAWKTTTSRRLRATTHR